MEIYHFFKYTNSIFKFYIFFFKEKLLWKITFWGLRNPSKIHLFPWFHLSLILSVSSVQIMLKNFTLKKITHCSFSATGLMPFFTVAL